MKFACDCGKIAKWVYMPGFSSGDNDYFCEDCVPRGCSCNHELFPGVEIHDNIDIGQLPPENGKYKIIEENKYWCHVDEQGREYPCVEFSFDEDGYDFHKEYLIENKNYKYKTD